jgi:hypothetical protein
MGTVRAEGKLLSQGNSIFLNKREMLLREVLQQSLETRALTSFFSQKKFWRNGTLVPRAAGCLHGSLYSGTCENSCYEGGSKVCLLR